MCPIFWSCRWHAEWLTFFFFSSRRRHTRCSRDWSSDVCSSDLAAGPRSVRCGSVRNWVEAVEILEVDGSARRVERGVQGTARWHLDHAARELVRARFPRTRKNSAGYALDRFADSAAELDLLVGSEGTLAFVTAVEWRLGALPVGAAGRAPGLPPPRGLG